MPPRASLTSSFSVTDANNEVVCPLRNQDGSSCRKRCLGEKRFRSMQEHIRRAHPEYYIPKLPATKESFELMITSPPHERPPPDNPPPNAHHLPNAVQHVHHPHPHPHPHPHHTSDPSGLSPFQLDPSGAGLSSSFEGGYGLGTHDGGYYTAGDAEAAAIYNSMQAQQRSSDEYIRRGSLIPAASAAQALAQLHYHRPDSSSGGAGPMDGGAGGGWMGPNDLGQNFYADQASAHHDLLSKSSNHFHVDPALEDAGFMPPDHAGLHDPTSFPHSSAMDQPGLLPSSLARSPPDRQGNSLPSLQRSVSRSHHRPRKSSLTQQARLAKHERKKSKELAKRSSGGDRKAVSAEPSAAALYGKRWEDLIDAATSATEEEGSRDLTPIPASPNGGGYPSPAQVPSRTSLPPFALASQFQSFQASPLNRALTPPTAADTTTHLPDLHTFPSVDSSLSSISAHHHGGGGHPHHAHHSSADSSGSQFQIMHPSSMDSTTTSPLFPSSAAANGPGVSSSGGGIDTDTIQIYCAGCRRLSVLKDSYACTNCICGLCGNCVEAILSGQSRGRMSMCPRCHGMDSGFKPFQLDLR